MLTPERRTTTDVVVAVAIALAVVVAVSVVWLRSDARGTTSVEAASPLPTPSTALSVPERVTELWRQQGDAGDDAPVTAGGAVVVHDGHTVTGLDPATGAVAWSYTRDADLCTVVASWNTAVAVYRDDRGCGQVTELDGATGGRKAQRTSDADDPVHLSSDGTYVTSRGSSRMEIWRSDMVRTLEYGRVDAPVNPGDQPRSGCTLLSSVSSSSRVAVLEQCPNEQAPRLTSMNPAPKDNTKPDVYGSTILTDVPAAAADGARLLAVSGDRIAAYLPAAPGAAPRIGVFDGSGNFVTAQPLSTPVTTDAADTAPVTKVGSVLAWWTGAGTVGLAQGDFAPRWSIPGALGPGAAMAGQLVVPTAGALSVVDPSTGIVSRTIAVDRGTWTGRVFLTVLGSRLFEQRGTDLVALG